ncbi:transcription elongation factor S-II [Sphaeroforma arctica JP610]|uniref:Transcription elongation factor S-II n=1 Tax=Sphaeroforma arctica JP610 TaxID=667725 RepID=A0A0L0FLN5_9EUKA|nr:transcription elongation factor S-II [Sphaeroforma arctica JP610]KNC77665.1 transcription elongation factor S-II [Sphaeroforma arctica JP610]|eukprot:XP_014151567.1 transcription elongation factor S-II [Sphaeroforma arctica JP610]
MWAIGGWLIYVYIRVKGAPCMPGETKIGKTLQKLKKATSDSDVKKKCMDIIADWKKIAGAGGAALSSQPSVASAPPATESSVPTTSPKPQPKVKPEPPKPAAPAQPTNNAIKRRVSVEVAGVVKTGNATRDTCRTMLANALKTDENASQYDVGNIASSLETAIFELHPGVDQKYKNLVRSRRSNLQDVKNHDLRKRVLEGDISAKQLATMSTQELANKDILAEIERAKKEAEMDAQIGNVANRTQTHQFQCGKCKKNDTSFFQMQTRSADEPMTTFVTCNVCGNKWKFC